MPELIIIIALLVFIAFREWRHESHIRDLEEKLTMSVPTVGYLAKENTNKPAQSNPIMNETPNEVMLGEIPFMDIPKDFKIETESDATTPMEARARNK